MNNNKEQRRRIAEAIDSLRLQPLPSTMAQALREKWVRAVPYVSSEHKDEIGKLWMTKILGVNEETVKGFIQGDSMADREVGLLHAGVNERRDDVVGFWQGVLELMPQFATEGEFEFLTKEDPDADGPFLLITTFDFNNHVDWANTSSVIRKLLLNAHVYK